METLYLLVAVTVQNIALTQVGPFHTMEACEKARVQIAHAREQGNEKWAEKTRAFMVCVPNK